VLAVSAALGYGFLYAPLLVLVAFSFNRSRLAIWEGASLRWYSAVFQDAQLAEAFFNSVLIGALATVIATTLGTVAAYGLWKRPWPAFSSALGLSLLTPEVVWGVALLAFFQGVFRVLGFHLGVHTVVLAHASFCLAYVVLVVLARLRRLDPSLEEAAQDLGAPPLAAFVRVVLPQLWPGVLAAALLAFTVSFDDYVITSLVAGVNSETLPMVIYALARRGGSPVLNALSTLIFITLGAGILFAQRLEQQA
jgi:spermidine/putrescine transport system permease protein